MKGVIPYEKLCEALRRSRGEETEAPGADVAEITTGAEVLDEPEELASAVPTGNLAGESQEAVSIHPDDIVE